MTDTLVQGNFGLTCGQSTGLVLVQRPPGTPFLMPRCRLCFVFSVSGLGVL